MQTEKTIIALFLITLGMFMLDYAAIKIGSRIKNRFLSGTFSVISTVITIVFGAMIVLALQSV